ncbi:hypothetical protein BMF94_3222 [Rhodotorula taiwanensis]|uniref:Uncharacterized protein n=1 Tax=Rhodotorula taiwanensis TaxID=741276 RepID=A0A2S5BA93_9BASI|nr:hypothetical protein BMF94_3222 [Rhodotorula taiwanensis]
MAPSDQSTLEHYKQQAIEDFSRANSAVTSKAKDLHARYVDPNLRVVASHAQHAPVAATLIGVFGLFALLPVLLFLSFAIGVVLVVGGGAFLFAAVVIGWLIGSAALLLLGTLAVVFFLSVATTGFLVSAFLAYRFATLLSHSDTLPDALKSFQSEATKLLVPPALSQRIGSRPSLHRAPSSKVHFDSVVKEEGVGEVPVKED